MHRPEFAEFWDVSVLLEASHRRDGEWLDFLLGDLPDGAAERADALDDRLTRARWPRYREGWRSCLDAVQPAAAATFTVDNNDLYCPVIL